MSREGLANFFLGLGVGVGVGLLFAPKSGEETRETLMHKADEGKEYLRKQATDLRESASDVVDKGRDAVQRQKGTLNDAMDAAKQAYHDKIDPVVNKAV